MKIEHFELELKKLHTDFKIIRNIKAKGLATVFFKTEPLFAIPAEGIYDEPRANYGIEHPISGNILRHRTRPEALQMAKAILYRLMNDSDYGDALMGEGAYSKEALKPDKPAPANFLLNE
jgi:hypothetical protein